VFVRSWSQQANLNASDSVTGDQLGWSVSVDGDNAFVQSGSSLTQQAKLTASYVGLGQINMQIPKLTKGTYPVVIKQGGQTAIIR
jgi:uncharacterized protein (TIGR03437 family)